MFSRGRLAPHGVVISSMVTSCVAACGESRLLRTAPGMSSKLAMLWASAGEYQDS
jgi:hypothetical protein